MKPTMNSILSGSLVVVLLVACGGGSDDEIGRSVPSDVPPLVRQHYLRYSGPPSGYAVAVPWLTAIHDERSTQPSKVEVDYLRAYCQGTSGPRLVSSYEYNDSRVEGGLWRRRPNWFASGYLESLSATFDLPSDSVSFTPSANPAAAWHLWGPRGDVELLIPAATKCWMEASVRITGAALIQGGLDYYQSMGSSNPTEAGVSDWLFEAPGWQTFSFGK